MHRKSHTGEMPRQRPALSTHQQKARHAPCEPHELRGAAQGTVPAARSLPTAKPQAQRSGFSGAHLHHRLAVGLMAASITSEAQAATKRTLEVGRELQLQEGNASLLGIHLPFRLVLQFSALWVDTSGIQRGSSASRHHTGSHSPTCMHRHKLAAAAASLSRPKRFADVARG